MEPCRILLGLQYGDHSPEASFGSYDGCFDTGDETRHRTERFSDEPIKPLDRIEVAGAVNINLLHSTVQRLGLTVLADGIGIIDDNVSPLGAEIRNQLKKETTLLPRRRPTMTRYADHFTNLHAATILIAASPGGCQARFWSTYFAVPKGLDAMRAIFNGSKLSIISGIPRAVNLPGMRAMVEKMLHQSEKGRKMHLIVGDFRHWFHQLRMSRHLHPFFALQCGKKGLVLVHLSDGMELVAARSTMLCVGRSASLPRSEVPHLQPLGVPRKRPTNLRQHSGWFLHSVLRQFPIC